MEKGREVQQQRTLRGTLIGYVEKIKSMEESGQTCKMGKESARKRKAGHKAQGIE